MSHAPVTTPEERAAKRVKNLADLLWHAAAFLVVNAFLWTIDLIGGGGLDYAYWTTIPWGVGLAFHGFAYLIGGRGLADQRYERYLAEELERENRPEGQLH